MSEWISVEDGLPEAGGLYLAGKRVLIFYDKWREIFIASRVFTSPDDWCWMDEEDDCYAPLAVTHWMPLPEPPK